MLIELFALAGAATAATGGALHMRSLRADGPPQGDCPDVMGHPHGRLFGLPNWIVGLGYCVAVMVVFALPADVSAVRVVRWAVAVAAVAAAGVSVYLLWSLMAVVRRPCRVCLTANAINLVLTGLILAAVVGR